MKRIFTLLLALGMGSACAMARDIKVIVVTPTPQMHCNNCEVKIKKNLRFEKGVKDIVTSLDNQTVTIKYDADKTSPTLLLKAFEKFGYTAQEVKPASEPKPTKQKGKEKE